ncbi:MAG TPA: DNA translocase FtsK, partial [Baekduia sp.]
MATTRTPAPRKRKPAPKSKTTASSAARKRKPPARARARRSSATWAPRLPIIEQRHLDLFGLALVACGVFLAFPLYFGWDGGQVGDGVIDGLALAVGSLRFIAPLGVIAAGAIIVLRPVLPSVRPFKSGGLLLVLALALMLAAGTLGLGPDGIRHGFWHQDFLRVRGGYLGEALFYITSTLIGSIGTHILALFLLLAGVLLLTGASVAGVLQATSASVAESTRALRTAPAPVGLRRDSAAETSAGRRAAASEKTKGGSATGKRPRVQVPEPGDLDLVVKATHVEAPALDGEERYPDIFGDDEAPTPDDLAAELEETRTKKRKPKAKKPPPEPVVIPDGLGDDGVDDPLDAAVDEAVVSAEDVEQDPADDDGGVGGGRILELPAARGEDDGEEIEYVVPDPRVLKRSTGDQIRPDTSGNEKTAAALIEALSHFN